MPTASFVLTLKDHEALSERILRKKAGFAYFIVRWMWPLFLCIVIAAALAPLWRRGSLVPASGHWLETYGAAGFWLVLGLHSVVTRPINRRRLRKSPRFGRLVQVTLEQDGVREETGGSRAFQPWTQIQRIEETSRHFFLFINDNRAFVVPRSSFSTPEEGESFVRFALERYASFHPRASRSPIASPH